MVYQTTNINHYLVEHWINQRNHNFDARYKFSAKELDDESGYTYFGARYYDPELSNWLSVDPLAKDYPSFSPYMYCFGNPLAYVDFDGEEGVKIIKSNTQNPTITVKANYYVQSKPIPGITPASKTSYDKIAINAMNKKINNTLNNANYKVTEGKYEGYNVEFDLSFSEGGDSWNLDDLAKDDFYNNIPIGNTLRKRDEKTLDYFNENPNCGAVTEYNKDIYMRSGRDSKRSKIHEVFHTLFFDRDGAEKGIGNYTPGVDMPNQEDINILINNPSLPAIHE